MALRVFALVLSTVLTLAPGAPAPAQTLFPAARPGGGVLTVYSALDERLAAPLIAAFQAARPEVAVAYEELLTGEILSRVTAETDAGGPTADFVLSSGMDLQMKLANDGYARAVAPGGVAWPDWAVWRGMAYALTFEPVGMIYHRPSFPDGPPQSRRALLDWLRTAPEGAGVGTYDIARSALGLFFLARDEEHFPDIWQLLAAMRAQRLEAYPTSLEVIERVADGRLALGYNILIPYAAAEAERRPDLGLILPRDYTVVFSRVALVPRAAARPDLGEAFLQFLMSPAGQELMASRLRLPAVSPEVEGGDSAATLTARMGERLRPVSVSPGLLAYLDQAKRRRLLARWAEVAGRQVPDSLAP